MLKQKLYDLSARNPLVNANHDKLWFIERDLNNASSIYKKQRYFIKEYGLQTTLLVTHFIRWKPINKNTYYTSPLIYQPIQIVKNQKINLQFEYNLLDDLKIINPILQDVFSKSFDIDLKLFNENIDRFINELKSELETNGDTINLLNTWNNDQEWQIITTNAIGSFNYKKSILGQDYDEFISHPNQSIKSILGDGNIQTIQSDQKFLNLSLSDTAQKEAINLSFNNNLVIQGPPGTGKSHTIVELIKQKLLANKKVLFISEKKSALDIVFGKLKEENLNHLVAYFNSEKNQKKEFYANLKLAIEKSLNSTEFDNNLNTEIKELENYFNSYSKTLTQTNEKLDGSIYDLISYLAKHQITDLEHNVEYKIPSYKLWFNYIEFLEDIEEIGISNFNVNSIAELPFIDLNKFAFVGNNPLSKIETRLKELDNWTEEVKTILRKYNFNWSWSDLYKYCLAASVLNMANRSQLDILDPNSKNYKSFNTWTKKYELTQNKLKLSNDLCAKWEVKPKLADIDVLLEDLSQNKTKSWLYFFKKTKSNDAFKFYKGDLSTQLKINALESLKENYLLKSLLTELGIKLKHNLNILNPDIDINHLLHLRQKLDTLSSNQYVYLLEHDKSLELIADLHLLHPHIQKSNQIIKFLFVDFKCETINDITKKVKTIRQQSAKFKYFLPEIKKTLNLPFELLNFIKSNPHQIDHLSKTVVYHNYLEQVRFEPVLKNIESIDIIPNYKSLKKLKKDKNDQIKSNINQIWSKNRRNIEELLNTPASKLKGKQKEEKQRQKQSKRVIFHEISKKQQHLSIKSLVKETNHAIFDIQPLWIMNPLSIAESLPCNEDLFDVVIFDESSQIPLEDALPAIYRSKQVIVVGDSKQMPPSQFFSSTTESVTLLNQAESVFNSNLLTWHYRSEHPKLMQFSNQHFYDNELCYFPSVSDNNPVELIKVNNGIFEDGKNKREAFEVAKTYESLLKSGCKNIAIIAFSKEQEKQIEAEIINRNLPTNTDLLVRNLENAQGIEKDVVIISVGYGFNPEGNFRMNFGPLNQDYGANRLNVLLTRAKQKMIVITSVHSNDFKPSENRGVQLLRDFLRFSEENENTQNQSPEHFIHQQVNTLLKDSNVNFYSAINGLAVNCFVQHSTKKILLIDPSLNKNENKDIYTILSVLDDRFLSVKLLLSHDYWNNKKRFESDILKYFK